MNWKFDKSDIRNTSCVDGIQEQKSGRTNNEVNFEKSIMN